MTNDNIYDEMVMDLSLLKEEKMNAAVTLELHKGLHVLFNRETIERLILQFNMHIAHAVL